MRTENRDISAPSGYGNRKPEPELEVRAESKRSPVVGVVLVELVSIVASLAAQVPGAHQIEARLRALKATLE